MFTKEPYNGTCFQRALVAEVPFSLLLRTMLPISRDFVNGLGSFELSRPLTTAFEEAAGPLPYLASRKS